MSPYSSYSSLLTSQKEELRRKKLESSLKETRIYVWQRIIASLLLHIKPMICGNTPAKYQQVQTLGFAITIFVFGRSLLSQLGRVQGEGDGGSN